MNRMLLVIYVFYSVSLTAQNIELAWQPHAVTEIGLVQPISGCTIICSNTPHPEGNFDPQLMKLDTNGTILWVTEFQISDYVINFWPIDVEERTNGELWLTYNSFDCDFPSPSGLIRFSASGEYIEHWSLNDPEELPGNTLFQDTSENSPLLFWRYKALNILALYRWRYLLNEPTELPVIVSQNYAPSLLRQNNGRLLISDNNSIKVFNPFTDTIGQTLATLSQPIYNMCEGANNHFYAASDSTIWHLDQDGQVIHEMTFTDKNLRTIWFFQDYVFVKDIITKDYTEIHVFSDSLTPLHTILPFTSDTKLEGVSFSNNHLMVWGNETYNGFIKEIAFDGSYEPLIQDAAILDFTYGSIGTTATKNPDGYHNLQVILQDVEVLIENKGSTTLHDLHVNWNKLIAPPLPPNCTHYEFEHPVSNLNLLPGESAWVPVSDIHFGIYHNVTALPYPVSFTKCLTLSTPDEFIDINHNNDSFCRQISAVIVNQETFNVENIPHIQPNPFSDVLFLENIPAHYKSAELYNILGQPVLKQELASQMETIKIPNLGAGIFQLLFRDNKGSVVFHHTLIRS